MTPFWRLILTCLLQLIALLLGLVYGRRIVLCWRVDGIQNLSFGVAPVSDRQYYTMTRGVAVPVESLRTKGVGPVLTN